MTVPVPTAGGPPRPVADFLGAAQFLTRIPIRLTRPPVQADCVPWFPIVGACIGLAVGAVAAGLMEVVPASVAAAVAVLVGVLVTGAFHEDGLADLADSMGGWTPAQRREILKDSRHGSYGVAALCGSIVLRIVCVATLGPAVALAGLVAAHTLGRSAAVGVMIAARDRSAIPGDGLGSTATERLRPRAAMVGVFAGVAVAAAATGWWALPLAVGAAIGAAVVARIAIRALESINGDALGAIEQVGECVVLVIVTGLA
ncbi:MAG: adenosylcobinamide-GDP ribazoletransferase, partial [Ilumatobacteraceae bacterium]